MNALIGGTQRLGGIFNKNSSVCIANGPKLIDLTGRTVKMCRHNDLSSRVQLKCLLQGNGVHVPGIALSIDKYRDATLIYNWVHRSVERHIAAKDLITGLNSSEFHGKMQRRSTARKGNGIAATNLFGHLALDLIYVLAYRRHPVSLVGFGDVFKLITMHGRRTKPNLILEGFNVHLGSLSLIVKLRMICRYNLSKNGLNSVVILVEAVMKLLELVFDLFHLVGLGCGNANLGVLGRQELLVVH